MICTLLAQAPTIEPGVAALVGNLGTVGVLVWFLYYHTTKSYPQMLEKFSAEIKELRDTFENEQEKLRETFQREQDRTRDTHKSEQGELRKMLIDNLQATRTAVHDVKNIAQTALYREAAAEAAASAARANGGK